MLMSYREYDDTFGSAWHVKGDAIAKFMVYTTYAGSPASNLTPTHIGQSCLDTTNDDFYLATGLTSSDWKQITA